MIKHYVPDEKYWLENKESIRGKYIDKCYLRYNPKKYPCIAVLECMCECPDEIDFIYLDDFEKYREIS